MTRIATLFCRSIENYVAVYLSHTNETYITSHQYGTRFSIYPHPSKVSYRKYIKHLEATGYEKITTHYVDPSGALQMTDEKTNAI
jgi:hypothetical protein